MSEKQQQDQTHGYNSKAAEAIAKMPKDDWDELPIPNETAYNESQTDLGKDPEAMNRSNEMEMWSKRAGVYAEKASSEQEWLTKSGQHEVQTARDIEQLDNQKKDQSKRLASEGVSAKEGYHMVRLIPKANGMVIDRKNSLSFGEPTTPSFVRSPATIRDDQEEIKENEEIKKEAIRKAKEII